MIDLNNLCLRVRIGEPRAIKNILEYYKVKSIINSSVKKIISHNPEYDAKSLYSIAESEIWDEIRSKYIGAEDLSKGNNLALRFIKSITYNRLMNFIRDEKELKWTKKGYHHKLPTVSVNYSGEEDDGVSMVDTLPDSEYETDQEVMRSERILIVRKVMDSLVKNGRMSVICSFILLLKFVKNMSYKEIGLVLKNQHDEDFSEAWIGGQISHGLKTLAEMLKPYKIC